MNWNYMLPAGASQVHPHLHVLVTDVACVHMYLEERFAMVYPEETAAVLRQEFGQ